MKRLFSYQMVCTLIALLIISQIGLTECLSLIKDAFGYLVTGIHP